jgi:very-short-patch-repair endonuclease
VINVRKTSKQLSIELVVGTRLEEWLREKYWEEEWPTTKLSKELGIQRKTLHNWMNQFGIKRRNFTEDMNRRYKNMSSEQKKQVTRAANEKVRKYGQPKKRGKTPAWVNSNKREEVARKISESKKGNKNPMTNEKFREKASKSLVDDFRKRNLEQEKVVCDYLDSKDVDYVFQYPVGRFVCDFAFPKESLIIEIDSIDKWGKEKWRKSKTRDLYLENRGWRVVHINKRHVLNDITILNKYLKP